MAAEAVNIKVAVRCRPMNDAEKQKKVSSVISCMTEQKKLVFETGTGKKKVSKTFSFDKVFGQYSSQREVFTSMVAPVVDEVMQGFNCTVFAYGQTGTGKTHTMEGNVNDSEQMGIIPRSVHYIFDKLDAAKADFNVRVSYLELYNEELGDLLGDDESGNSYASTSSSTSTMAKSAHSHSTSSKDSKTKKLMLCDSTKGVVCNNLTEIVATSPKEALEALHKGINQRQVAETHMNKASSRSHSIFTLKMMIKEISLEGVEQIRYGQLNLVDLAGSECVARSGATGARGREAGNINQSLLTLGRVINALVDPTTSHVPYRDSKLTRLLQESLGGRAKTCIVATLSPSSGAADETLSTLNYADTAKGVKNTPVINNLTSKRTVLKEYSHEMDELRLMLQSQRDKTGTYIPTEKYEEMIADIERSRSQLSECEGALSAMREEVNEHKTKAEELGETLRVSAAKCAAVETDLAETKDTLEKTSTQLEESESSLFATRAVVEEQVATEAQLTSEAEAEGAKLEESAKDLEGLFDKVQRMASHANDRSVTAANFGESALESAAFLKAKADELQVTVKDTTGDLEASMAEHLASTDDKMSEILKIINDGDAKFNAAMEEHTQQSLSALDGSSESVQAMQTAVAAASAAQTEALKEAAASVASSVQAVLAKLVAQQATIAAAAEAVTVAAESTNVSTSKFVAAHCISLDAAREVHAAEAAVARDGLATHVTSVRAFVSKQREGLEEMASEVAAQRESTAIAAAEALASETAAATVRAATVSNELEAVKEGFSIDVEALLEQMKTALGALQEKHVSALSDVESASSKRITDAAVAHSSAMNAMISEHHSTAAEATDEQTKRLISSVGAFESASLESISASTAAVEKADSNLSGAVSELKQSAQSFAQTSSVDTTARADSAKQSLSEMNENCSATALLGKELGSAHAIATAALEVGTEDATKASAAASEGILNATKSLRENIGGFTEVVGKLQGATSQATESAVEEGRNMGTSYAESVRSRSKDMFDCLDGVSSLHSQRTESLSDALRSHIEEMTVPVASTQSTPKKRIEVLQRIAIEGLSKTRLHDEIISEATLTFQKSKTGEDFGSSSSSPTAATETAVVPEATPAPEPMTPFATASKQTKGAPSTDAENKFTSKKKTSGKGSARVSSRRNSRVPSAADGQMHATTNPLATLHNNAMEA